MSRTPTSPRSAPGLADGRDGAALVLALLLLAIVSIIATEFLYEVRIHVTIVRNQEQKTRARYVAKAGQSFALGLLASGNAPEDGGKFNNEYVQLWRYTCMSTLILPDEDPSSRDKDEDEEPADFGDQENCGRWSLNLPYQLDGIPIEIEIMNEQARINLNALVKVNYSKDQETVTASIDPVMYNVLLELFRLQAVRHEIQITDEQLRAMLDHLADYISVDPYSDYKSSYFDYGDRIVSMKKAPLDTIEEIKLLPEMSDELFNAVRDFLTVYPSKAGAGNVGPSFDGRVFIDAAPAEVVYALLMGTSYANDQPSMSPDQGIEIATRFVTKNCGADAQGARSLQPNASVPIDSIDRPRCPEMNDPRFVAMTIPKAVGTRFFRVNSIALADAGFETSIITVLKVERFRGANLYFRED